MRAMTAEPSPSATVVVLRDSERGPEVLLVRRHERSGDFAGASVFPGGLVEPGDADPALALADRRCASRPDRAPGGRALVSIAARARANRARARSTAAVRSLDHAGNRL